MKKEHELNENWKKNNNLSRIFVWMNKCLTDWMIDELWINNLLNEWMMNNEWINDWLNYWWIMNDEYMFDWLNDWIADE